MELVVLKYIGAGIMSLGMLGAAIGIGLIYAGAASAVARNPAAEGKIKSVAIFGAVLAELMGLLAFVGICLLLFVV